MDDRLRQELIAYFDRELGPPPAGIRDRVIRGLSEPRFHDHDPGPGRRTGLLVRLAGVAVVLVAMVAFAGLLLLTHPHHAPAVRGRPNTSAPPTAAPTPTAATTPVSTPFSAPDSVTAIVFGDPANRTQIDAVTWNGSRLGYLPGLGAGSSWAPNPSATLFAGPSSVVNRRGQVVAALAPSGKTLPVWADDGHTLCRTTPEPQANSSSPATLQLATVGGDWRTVGQFGTVSENAGVDIAACSVLNDRAVLVERSYQGPNVRQLWVVQLSTGRVLWSRPYPADGNATIEVVASRDGAFVAVGRSTCCPHTAFTTTVYGADGGLTGTFDGHAGGYAGTAFSWDGSRMVLATGADDSQVTVVDVRAGTTVWRAPAGLKVAGIVAEPVARGRLGIALNGTGAVAGPDGYVAAADLYLVDAAGHARPLSIQIRPL